MTPDAPDADAVLLPPITINPDVVRVAAPAARAAARRLIGRHDIDFARRVPIDEEEDERIAAGKS